MHRNGKWFQAYQRKKSLTQRFMGWERWTEPWWGRTPSGSDPKGIPVFSPSSPCPCGLYLWASFSSLESPSSLAQPPIASTPLLWEAYTFAWISRPPRIYSTLPSVPQPLANPPSRLVSLSPLNHLQPKFIQVHLILEHSMGGRTASLTSSHPSKPRPSPTSTLTCFLATPALTDSESDLSRLHVGCSGYLALNYSQTAPCEHSRSHQADSDFPWSLSHISRILCHHAFPRPHWLAPCEAQTSPLTLLQFLFIIWHSLGDPEGELTSLHGHGIKGGTLHDGFFRLVITAFFFFFFKVLTISTSYFS